MYDTISSMSPRLMFLLSCDMRNEQICKTINLSRGSISLHIIEDKNLESELKWRIPGVNPNSLEIGSINLDRPS